MTRTWGETYEVWRYVDEEGKVFYKAEKHRPTTELIELEEAGQLGEIVYEDMSKEAAEKWAEALNRKEQGENEPPSPKEPISG